MIANKCGITEDIHKHNYFTSLFNDDDDDDDEDLDDKTNEIWNVFNNVCASLAH